MDVIRLPNVKRRVGALEHIDKELSASRRRQVRQPLTFFGDHEIKKDVMGAKAQVSVAIESE